jgi:single-stranded-DNA-specific exonuclease
LEHLSTALALASSEPCPPPAFPSLPGPGARALGLALGVTPTLAGFLERSGHSDVEATRRFLNPRLSELSAPDGMLDRGAAAARLARAVRARERIAVFGDYDCDGMTSAAILSEVIEALGGEAVTLLASRFEGGYGLSGPALGRVLAANPGLLVTCDCGSSDHESLLEAKRRGIDVVVIDHHLVPDEPLPALAFLNPHRPGCGFPYKGLASCGLVLSVAAALRAELDQKLDLRPWLDLVAIGTIADVAPLDGDNRALVRAGLKLLGEARRPGVRALLDLAGIEPCAALGAEDIAYRLAPRLNAPGRLAAPDLAVQLLLAKTSERARALAAEVEQRSLERRALQDRMLEEALAEIEGEGWDERPAIVVGREGWNHGIVGIVAGRLASRFARPVVVIGFENGRGRGSVRGPKGARLHDALALAKDALVRFGGHQAAAGVEIELGRLAEFRERFELASASHGEPVRDTLGEAPPVAALFPGDDPRAVLADLALLEPCGEGNPKPDIALEARVIHARSVTGGHLKLELDVSGARLGAFGVGMGERAAGIGEAVFIAGALRPDRFRGGGAVELRIQRIY